MSEQSWSNVLRNRDAFPDDMVIDVNGSPIALGALRDSAIPKEDMTRLTQGWSERDRAAQTRIDQLQSQLAQALTTANDYESRLRAQNDYESSVPSGANGAPGIDYERDPILGPIFTQAKQAAERQRQTEANLERLEKMLQGIGSQLGQWPVMMALDQIKRNDPYGVDPQTLVQHALNQRQGPPNLNDSYTLLTREQREAQIRAEAEKAGMDKAKRELAVGVPHHPYGPPQTVRMPEPTYATMDEAENAAVMDPEMLAILMGQG
jgi:hypothetical protein